MEEEREALIRRKRKRKKRRMKLVSKSRFPFNTFTKSSILDSLAVDFR
jgi:hypothetical protein